MVPEEWPIAGPAAEPAGMPARRAGRDRLATVRRDFFLNPDQRLSEQERALMTAMLHTLVADIADELRSVLPPESAAANDDDNADLVTELSASGLLDRPQLVALLLARADEEQISSAVRARHARRDARFLQPLVSDDDASISAAAMALILARGRRRDRFGQVRLEFDDVPAAAALHLVHSVAAALRPRLLRTSRHGATDRQLGQAAAALLARHDFGRSLEALPATLVRLLAEAGRIDDELIAVSADEGELSFLAEALAWRGGIPAAEARNLLTGHGAAELMLLLRMAGLSREFAARILAGPGEVLGVTDPASEISRFDALPAGDVESAREWFKLNPAYRAALHNLGQDDGHGAL